ncbi:MAG TPA: alpha/beta fold hydrolase [Polyangiaceae bacterium]|jgi:pimeloyl-ACP methyl ester carboxylesterase|nr:alpha/beta fold hydrolase [Polyangiaceae bacterium]
MHKLFALFLVGALVGCEPEDETQAPPEAETYLLVHGAFAGAWTWDEVVTQVETAGHRAITLDLPAHGDDPTMPADATLDSYTARVVEELDSAEKPVVLVGHSMGGLVVSQAAEARPDKVKKLVYVAAFLVPDGTSLLEASMGDTESQLANYAMPNADGTVTLAEEGILGAFCSDCDDTQAGEIAARLRPEPLAPFTTGILTTNENWGRVPRIYIETLQDLAIGPARQKSFYEALPCERVISIDSGHCPFLTRPTELADALLSL